MSDPAGRVSVKSLSIKELPKGERPRERLKQHGARSLGVSELLAIVLGTGVGGRSTLALAQVLLSRADGSLRRIASQPVAALTAEHGVGPVRAVVIHAALELGRRMADESRDEGPPMRSPRDVFGVFSGRLEDLPVEEFHVAVLDAQH